MTATVHIPAAISPTAADLHTILSEITAVTARFDTTAADAAVDTLLTADRVLVTGEGRSGFMARAFAMRLMHLGLPVHVIGETTCPAVTATDTVVAVSGSGATVGTVRVARTAAELGGTVLAVTTDPASPLAAAATMTIVVPAATKYRRPGEPATIQPLSSLFDQVTHLVLDTMCLGIAARRGVDNGAAAARHANTE